MPRLTTPQELAHLVARIAAAPNGLGIDELLQAQDNTLQRRTLQRRLASLVAQGRIQTVGEAGAVLCRVAPIVGNASLTDLPDTLHATGEVCVPTSPEGEAIKALVRQPRQLRPPVGHKLEFLERYHPNHTAYLPPALRNQLHALGRSPAHQTPAGTFAQGIFNRLLIDLSWASSQMEGNTYSRLDTERLIEFGQAAEGKNALETQMILNHKKAIEYLVRDPSAASLTPQTVIACMPFCPTA